MNTYGRIALAAIVGFFIGLLYSHPHPVKASGTIYVKKAVMGLNYDALLGNVVGMSCVQESNGATSCYLATQ